MVFTASKMVLLCPLCPAHPETNLRLLLKHIRLIHADEPNFSIQCTFQGCLRPPFRTYYSYRNHIYTFHGNFAGEDSVQDESDEGGSHDDTSSEGDSSDDDSETEDGAHGTNGSTTFNGSTAEDIKRAAATWILKVREKHMIPQSTIEMILKDIDTLYEVSLHYIINYILL